MNIMKSQKGQALVVIALAAVVLFGFAALAIDGSRVFSDRRHAQNTADTSALAAALAKIRNPLVANAARDAALARAASNSYNNNGTSNVVTVNNPPVSGPYSCANRPATCNEYIQVTITSHVPTTFARVLGWSQLTNTVDAVARAKGSVITPNPLSGAGLVSVKGGANNNCFIVNGTAALNVHGSGIFVNCEGSSALFLNGSSMQLSMDLDAQVAGCSNNPTWDVSPGQIKCDPSYAQTFDASDFAGYPTTDPTPTCTNPGGQTGNAFTPGYFNSLVRIQNATGTFAPGTYCFNLGLQIVGGSSSMSGTGLVQFVFASGQGLDVKVNATFDELEIFHNNANFILNGGTLTANRLRFFGNGSSSFNVQGGTLTSGNAYVYSEGGMIDVQAHASVNLTAATSGTYAGLLYHMPWSNTNAFQLNGGTDDRLTGTILIPHSDVTLNGGSGFELHGQVIGYTIKVNGGSSTDIFFDATTSIPPGGIPSIELSD